MIIYQLQWGFNPYFTRTGPETELQDYTETMCKGFNPYFTRTGPETIRANQIYLNRRSFNPYFTRKEPETVEHFKQDWREAVFQSSFYKEGA